MAAKLGKVLAPKKTGKWVVILRLEKYILAQLDTNTAKRLMDELFNNWLNKEIQNQVRFQLEALWRSLQSDSRLPRYALHWDTSPV